MSTLLGLLLALLIPLYFLRTIQKFDFYQVGQFPTILKCLVWGGVAYAPATFTNLVLKNIGLTNSENLVHLIAPIHEEIFKGLILLYFVRHARFSYSVDGAIYGFAVGIGFAVIENIDYIRIDIPAAQIIAVQRIFSANLIHASSSALIGIALGTTRIRRFRLHWPIFIFGTAIAIGQHMFYNMINHNGTRSLVVAILTGFLSVGLILILMKFSQKQAQNWIKERLGMDDRVTRNEVIAIDRLANTDKVLLPVVERFGPETASQVEQLLYLQARIGIKRKALEGFGKNDTIRSAVEAEINRMRMEMENVQREIGTYAMLFVRGLFSEEMLSVWDQMQAKIRERSAAEDGQKRGGVWLSLEERIKSTIADEEST